jgi:MYXO-CTERM domain-containing protein
MKHVLIAVVGSASIVAGADAGFAGFVAYSRNVGANTVIDVFAAVDNASDKFLNIYNTESNGTFVQKAGLATKTWKPDVSGFTSTRNTADDSFMTAGTFSGGAYGGEYYASGNTTADPNFTGTSWNATPASAAATTIPFAPPGNSGAGWYTGDPTSVDNTAELMSTWAGSFSRTNSVKLAGAASAPGTSDAAVYGIWCAHLVVAGNNRQIGTDFTFKAWASIKDGTTGSTSQAQYSVPAPGALSLLSVVGLAARGRRRA